MAWQFDTGIFSVIGEDSIIAPGMSLTFYASGTSTPLNTYTLPDLVTPNTNPLVCNSAGRFAAIWMQELDYKVVLKNADDTIAVTRDPVRNPAFGALEGVADLAADLAASSGSGLIGFSHASIYASGTVGKRLKTVVNVTDAPYNAVGDGVANDTAALQAAFNSGAKRIVGKAGDIYRITQPVVLDASNTELDFYGATINLDDATGLLDHLQVGNGATQRAGIKIKNTTFTRSQVATAGYAINLDYVGVVEVSGNRIFGDNKIWRGIQVQRGIIVNINNNYIDNYIDFGVYLIGTGTGGNRTVDVSMTGNRIEGGVSPLATYDYVEGLFCRNNIFFNGSGSLVTVDASSNANGLFSFKFQQNDFDTSTGSGLYIDKVSNVQVTGNWFSSNTADSLQIKSDVQSVVVSGNQIYPTDAGVRIEGDDVVVSGNLISAGETGINITTNASNVQITGNIIAYSTVIGVDFNSNTSVQMSANKLTGISGLPIANEPAGAYITDNSGDPSAGLSSVVTVGASPFTYTAGPRPEFVAIRGGTVSSVTAGGNTIATASPFGVSLKPGGSIIVTYSSLPTIVRVLN